MADGAIAFQGFQILLGKDLRDEAHTLVEVEGLSIPVAGGDASALLPTVLQGKEAVVVEERGILVAVDGEDAAFMFGTVGLGQEKGR